MVLSPVLVVVVELVVELVPGLFLVWVVESDQQVAHPGDVELYHPASSDQIRFRFCLDR